MSKSWRYSLSIICLSLLVALLWQTPTTREIISNKPRNVLVRYPDAIMEQAYTEQFNNQGKLEYILNSQEIRFFEANSEKQAYIEYQKPELIFYGDGQSAPIRLTSKAGYSRDDGNTIELAEQVILSQIFENDQQYRLTTESLTILPAAQFAETDKPVMITEPSGVTTATGLKADFKAQRFELLSNVRGNYAQQ